MSPTSENLQKLFFPPHPLSSFVIFS
jgi:hypothetical protein